MVLNSEEVASMIAGTEGQEAGSSTVQRPSLELKLQNEAAADSMSVKPWRELPEACLHAFLCIIVELTFS